MPTPDAPDLDEMIDLDELIDLDAARSFMTGHARLLDRRRFAWLLGDGSADAVATVLDGYHNPDGGYGWGLEPDQRSTTSQPVAAMQALEVLADLGRAGGRRAAELCDWLAERSLPDGGMPFGLAHDDAGSSAPHWVSADPGISSLQMTAQLAAQAHRIARHDPEIAEHPWLGAATAYCLDTIDAIDRAPNAYELMFCLQFLDVVADRVREARPLLQRLIAFVRSDGPTPVEGGTEDEVLHPLDFSPYADARSRASFAPGVVEAEIQRIASGQQADGGWTVDFATYSPAAALAWRGYATLQAVATLRGRTI